MAAFARARGLRPHAKTQEAPRSRACSWSRRRRRACRRPPRRRRWPTPASTTSTTSNEVIAADRLERGHACAAHPPGHRGGLGDRRRAAGARHRARAGSRIDVFVEVVGQAAAGVAPAQAGAPRARSSPTPGSRSPARATTAARSTCAAPPRLGRDPACHRCGIGRARLGHLAQGRVPARHRRGSGSFVFEAASGVYGEPQPGSYVFLDRDYAADRPRLARRPSSTPLFVATQVISRLGGARGRRRRTSRTPSTPGCCRVWQRATTSRSPTAATSTACCARPRADPARCRRSARRSGWCRALRPDRQPARPLRLRPWRPGRRHGRGRVARHRARLRRLTRRVRARRRRRSPGRACRCAGDPPG